MVKDFVNATEVAFRIKADDCDVFVLATTAIEAAYKRPEKEKMDNMVFYYNVYKSHSFFNS